MPKIFLSYRRQDSAGVAGRIYDRLRAHFGKDAVFMDIDAIPFGVDFREHIASAVDQCGILLAVIGRDWAGEAGAPRRIDDPRDFVRIEIESALERNLPVVPILIDRATMPGEADLPPSLARLAYRNAIALDPGRDFHHHADQLIHGIERALRPAKRSPPSARHRVPRPRVYLAVLPLLAVLGIIIHIVTDTGTVKITGTGENIVVRIDGGHEIRIENLGEPITLRTGSHDLEVKRGDLWVKTRTFQIRRGQETPLEVTFTPNPAPTEPGGSEKSKLPNPSKAVEPKPGASTVHVEVPKPAPPSPKAESPSIQPQKELTNSIGMKLTLIPAGEFMMGSDESDKDAEDDEFLDKASGKKQKHRVRITRPFYLGVTEVTRGQFRRFVDEAGYQTDAEKKDSGGGYGWNEETKKFERNPKFTWQNAGFEQTDDHPVVNVSWNDAQAFVAWLSRKEGKTYRLPTEAEWEYACRAGTMSRYFFGDDAEGLAAFGNTADGTAKEKHPDWTWAIAARDGSVYTAPVGRYKSNKWGLFDMHGNVYEWCSDGYAAEYYKESPVDDPPGAAQAESRVFRGGSWNFGSRYARSACRGWHVPGYRFHDLGFRVARVQSEG